MLVVRSQNILSKLVASQWIQIVDPKKPKQTILLSILQSYVWCLIDGTRSSKDVFAAVKRQFPKVTKTELMEIFFNFSKYQLVSFVDRDR